MKRVPIRACLVTGALLAVVAAVPILVPRTSPEYLAACLRSRIEEDQSSGQVNRRLADQGRRAFELGADARYPLEPFELWLSCPGANSPFLDAAERLAVEQTLHDGLSAAPSYEYGRALGAVGRDYPQLAQTGELSSAAKMLSQARSVAQGLVQAQRCLGTDAEQTRLIDRYAVPYVAAVGGGLGLLTSESALNESASLLASLMAEAPQPNCTSHRAATTAALMDRFAQGRVSGLPCRVHVNADEVELDCEF